MEEWSFRWRRPISNINIGIEHWKIIFQFESHVMFNKNNMQSIHLLNAKFKRNKHFFVKLIAFIVSFIQSPYVFHKLLFAKNENDSLYRSFCECILMKRPILFCLNLMILFCIFISLTIFQIFMKYYLFYNW